MNIMHIGDRVRVVRDKPHQLPTYGSLIGETGEIVNAKGSHYKVDLDDKTINIWTPWWGLKPIEGKD